MESGHTVMNRHQFPLSLGAAAAAAASGVYGGGVA